MKADQYQISTNTVETIQVKNRNVCSVITLNSSSLLGCSSDSRYAVNEFSEIPSLLEFHNVPGVSIVIIRNFKIDQLLVYGVKNQKTLALVTQDTLFQAGSISKSVTAIAALKMSQNGMIDLDEDINNELVSWAVEENEYTNEEKVNFRRLLGHSGGTTVHGFQGYSQNETVPSSHEILNGQAPQILLPLLWIIHRVGGLAIPVEDIGLLSKLSLT